MEKRQAGIILAKSPRPHFLIPETVIISKDTKRLTGKVCFPSSNESIGDRKHVNVSHSLFALWNCAHVLAFPFFKGEKKKLRAIHTVVDSPHPIPPDSNIDVTCSAVFDSNDKRKGTFNAEFSLNGEILHKVSVEFVAY